MRKMRKEKKYNVYSIAMKYMPLYILCLVFLFISQYLSSLVSLFIGQTLSIFAGEDGVLPGFFAQFIDNSSIYTQIKSMTILFFVVGVVMTLCRFLRTLFRNLFNIGLESDVSSKFFGHSIRLPKKYLANHPTGDIIQRNIQDSKKFTRFFTQGVFELFNYIFGLVVVLIQIFMLSKLNFFIGGGIIVFIIVFAVIYSFIFTRKKEKEMSNIASRMDAVTQQSFSNIMMVKSFANEEKEYDKLVKLNKEMQDTQYDLDMLYARYWIGMDIVSTIYNAVIILIIGYSFIHGNMGIGVASALILYNSDILDNASNMIDKVNRVMRNSVAAGRLNEYFKADDDFIIDGDKTPELVGAIKLENVSMKYEGEEKYALRNISLDVKPGETIGIVGKSGAGKSTLINILTRLDEYDEGSIKYDGVELKDINKKYLRENIGIVNQDSFIFAKTIEENLTILTDDKEHYAEYVDEVCLRDDIEKMPEKYKTIVGEKGVTLSGGQRQRISIARTLMKNKKILFLDDSLSAVDNNVSRAIKTSLKNKNATTFIISHNLMNVMDADKILVLDSGEIVEQGTHEELVAKKGVYNDIWSLQQKLKDGDSNEG